MPCPFTQINEDQEEEPQEDRKERPIPIPIPIPNEPFQPVDIPVDDRKIKIPKEIPTSIPDDPRIDLPWPDVWPPIVPPAKDPPREPPGEIPVQIPWIGPGPREPEPDEPDVPDKKAAFKKIPIKDVPVGGPARSQPQISSSLVFQEVEQWMRTLNQLFGQQPHLQGLPPLPTTRQRPLVPGPQTLSTAESFSTAERLWTQSYQDLLDTESGSTSGSRKKGLQSQFVNQGLDWENAGRLAAVAGVIGGGAYIAQQFGRSSGGARGPARFFNASDRYTANPGALRSRTPTSYTKTVEDLVN